MENDIILKRIRERLDQYKKAMQEGKHPHPYVSLDDIELIMLNWEPEKTPVHISDDDQAIGLISFREGGPKWVDDAQIKEWAKAEVPNSEVVRAVWEEGAKAIRDKIFGKDIPHQSKEGG